MPSAQPEINSPPPNPPEQQETTPFSESSYTPQEVELFNALPPQVKTLFEKRDAQWDRAFEERLGQLGEALENIKGMEKHLVEEAKAIGKSPDALFKEMLQGHRAMRENPEQTAQLLQSALQQRFAKLRQKHPTTAPENLQPTPEIAALAMRLQQVEALLQQQNHQRYTHAEGLTRHAIEAFLKEAHDDGQTKHPHVESVMTEMIPILRLIRETKPWLNPMEALSEAYQQALWLSPRTRGDQLAEESKQWRDKASKQAKKARSAIKGGAPASKGQGPGQAKPKTIKETMLEAYDRMNGEY
ncbi:hypothetical protein [Magnetofaba australis]|nr:hypothetical protein [Magnetofaba australis]